MNRSGLFVIPGDGIPWWRPVGLMVARYSVITWTRLMTLVDINYVFRPSFNGRIPKKVGGESAHFTPLTDCRIHGCRQGGVVGHLFAVNLLFTIR